ncbi:unnamed protein product [Adineta steineri]|uniref:Uncharacterized protein n=1 Tax=Adineta steineri TaxID=433720 RepID=A0A814B161_9BILA|nr:unnamed protein product [Adineta steineri]
MLRNTALLCLLLVISLSTSSSTLAKRKNLVRRQLNPQHCEAITGFDCKCSYYRVTCTIDHELPSPINIIENEKQKYQSVELVIAAPRDINVNDRTFEPIKDLYKSDGNNFEFRIKFEKFTSLRLTSPSIFNRVFPDDLPSDAQKHFALEIYNPDVPSNNNPNLFQNLNANSLEVYALYPFFGTFQQLFKDANIKFLHLSGFDVHSDVSQPFTGTIAHLELAKQADSLSVQNFPVYPVHELTINALSLTDFNSEHPSNYANLGELRVHSPDRIPANAFRQFPNIHTLSVQSDKGIDLQAFDGLTHLEKLTIKDSQPNLDLFNKLPNLKEFETNIEKLDENTQCKLIEKLANGQVAIQAIQDDRECTCVQAYLDTAAGRVPCNAQDCGASSCAVIKNNYNANTNTFNPPPPIRRSDGTNALLERDPRVYTAPFQVAPQDQQKLQNAALQQQQQQQQSEEDNRRPGGEHERPHSPNEPYKPQDTYDHSSNVDNSQTEKPYPDPSPKYENPWEDPNYYQSNVGNSQTEKPYSDPSTTDENSWDNEDYDVPDNEAEATTQRVTQDIWDQYPSDITTTVPSPYSIDDGYQGGQDSEESQPDSATARPDGIDAEEDATDSSNADITPAPPKKKMSWIPIIIIGAAIIGALLIGLIIMFLRKRRAAGGNKKGYTPTATTEQKV